MEAKKLKVGDMAYYCVRSVESNQWIEIKLTADDLEDMVEHPNLYRQIVLTSETK